MKTAELSSAWSRPAAVIVLAVMSVSGAWGDTGTQIVLYSFAGGSDGNHPQGKLIFVGGNLYGTTSPNGNRGGPCNPGGGCGTVFELTPSNGGWTQQAIYSCSATDCSDGQSPQSGLISDSAGDLYGTTLAGGGTGCGGAGCGTVFELTPSLGDWTYNVLHTFTGGSDGAFPYGGLVFDAAGNLYGTTSVGGNPSCVPYGCGTVFKLEISNGGWTESVIHAFQLDGTDGIYPAGTLVVDEAGNLYGTTNQGGSDGFGYGTIFELRPSNGQWTEAVLHAFNGVDGSNPAGGLMLDNTGNLYGVAGDLAFELSLVSGLWMETVIYRFRGSQYGDGSYPVGALVSDAAGNLYGATEVGGISGGCAGHGNGCGTLYELLPSNGGWTEQILYSFRGGTDGYFPWAGLVMDETGHLFGTTLEGGSGVCEGPGGCGVVFEVTPDGLFIPARSPSQIRRWSGR